MMNLFDLFVGILRLVIFHFFNTQHFSDTVTLSNWYLGRELRSWGYQKSGQIIATSDDLTPKGS